MSEIPEAPAPSFCGRTSGIFTLQALQVRTRPEDSLSPRRGDGVSYKGGGGEVGRGNLCEHVGTVRVESSPEKKLSQKYD